MFYITSLSEFCASNKIDDAKRDEGLTTPEGVRRFDDIRYGEHERNVLDVYRPKERDGTGSVVTRDIPENVLALGSPCRAVREIDERDREYFYSRSDEKIDWENLTAICESKSKHPKFQ